jgi:hypothetical protein
LHDNFRDLEENSIYNYNFEVRNGPFILWQYEAAVELLKEIVPEDNFRTLNEFGNEITWEKYQNFTDALCETYTTGKNIRNVTITGRFISWTHRTKSICRKLGPLSLY